MIFKNIFHHNIFTFKISRMLNAFTCLEHKNNNYDLNDKNIEFINKVYDLFEDIYGRF